MFNSNHYVPILKWKSAEKNALEMLNAEDKKFITPLIQFVMPKPKVPKEKTTSKTEDQKFAEVVTAFEVKIPKIHEEILKYWGKNPIFIDVSLLYTLPLKINSLKKIVEEGKKNNVIFIPVFNISDDQALKDVAYSLAKKHKTGLCLRLVSSDLIDIEVTNEKIKTFLKVSGITEKDIDLLVDIKEIEESGNKLQACTDASQKIFNLIEWRTFTLACGAFPADLSLCKIDEENLIPRLDWKNWKAQNDIKGILRKPSFSDYTIQHPIYKESSQFFHPTTSIKYTLESDWLVLKGKKQDFKLYLVNAKLLSEDARFYGENFSAGDKIIIEKAKHYPLYIKNPDIKGTGGTETWIIVGINHHFAVVVHQISNLL